MQDTTEMQRLCQLDVGSTYCDSFTKKAVQKSKKKLLVLQPPPPRRLSPPQNSLDLYISFCWILKLNLRGFVNMEVIVNTLDDSQIVFTKLVRN